MAKKPESKASSTGSKSFTDRVTEPMKNAGEKMRSAGAKAAENSQQLSVKAIDHAEENAREAFRALRAAAGAKSVQDVMKVQSDYIREQGARGMTQIREIGELIARFGREAVESVSGRSKDGGA